MNEVVDFINVNRDRYVEELKQYLAIPSVSALPEHAGDVRRAAEWTADALRAAGLENVRLIETPGNPVVYGDWLHAPSTSSGQAAPTILFYGHYDVQPVDPLELWESDPFAPKIVEDGDGRKVISARGAADDKGQLMTFVEACRAWKKVTGRLPIPVTVLLEGQGVHLPIIMKGGRFVKNAL